jgi:hypothetical protein
MKRNWLCTLLIADVIGMVFIACENPNGGGGGEEPFSISNSTWSDTLVPDTTLQFSATSVTLGGEPSGTGNKNWYWGTTMDGQTYPFDAVEDEGEILALLDQVEDNWGSDYTTLPDAVIVVWTNPEKNIGFQLHYYASGTGKNYERLICWGVGQPHEFKRGS